MVLLLTGLLGTVYTIAPICPNCQQLSAPALNEKATFEIFGDDFLYRRNEKGTRGGSQPRHDGKEQA